MNLISSIFLFTLLRVAVLGQQTTSLIVDQCMVSVNSTLEKDNYTENRIGFGLGIYHTFFLQNRINFNLGAEFNRTRQFEKSAYFGHFGSYNDLTYSKNCISVPLNFRVMFGQKRKYFFEAGGFWDWVISSKQKGTLHTGIPDGNGQIQDKYYDINEDAGFDNSFGVSFGIGVRIPGKEFDIIIKPDYKQKFNKWYYYKELALSKYLRLNLGIALK
jgi:hypothetical protein